MPEFERREDILKQREKALDEREKDLESKHLLMAYFVSKYLDVYRVQFACLGREKILNEQEKILEQKLSR